jgi:flagellin-like hook-associated protein FlgL
MSITSTSSLSMVQLLTSQLQAQDVSLGQLSTQLASQQKFSNLTDYSPTDAMNLLNLQDSATQRQAYIGVINTVQARMSAYGNTMTDMESVVSQAQNLVAGNGNFSPATASNMGIMAGNFLQSMTVDLNQQINGRYIYAGSRYNTLPVTGLAAMTSAPTSTIYNNNQTLPNYDTGNLNLTVSSGPNTITVGGTVSGSATIPQTATISINGTPHTFTLSSADTTQSQAATDIAAQLSTATGLTITASGTTITVPGSNTIDSATSLTTNAAAYATDSATIDAGNTLNYGVTSNNPAFQQIIAGLRFMQAAGNASDSATYQANMTQASTLLTAGLSALQTVNSSVAYNTNALTAETTAQNNAISDLTNQVANIQQVDITQVSAQITAMETQLQASYSVTGSLEKMSIVNYL